MKNKWIIPLLAFALLCPALAQDSCDVSFEKYMKATIIASYTPAFLIGFAAVLAHQRNEGFKHNNYDAFPDICTPLYQAHLIGGSYLALSSTLGTVWVGHDKKRIFRKSLLIHSLVIGSTILFYHITPWSVFFFGLYDALIPWITAKTACRIDEKFVRQSKGLTLVPSIRGTKHSVSFSLGIVF